MKPWAPNGGKRVVWELKMKKACSILLGSVLVAGCHPLDPQPSASQPASASLIDVTDIVGIDLGSPQSIQECTKVRDRLTGIGYEYPKKPVPCWTSMAAGESLSSSATYPADERHDGRVQVHFGRTNVPDGVAEDGYVMFLTGVPEEVILETSGTDVQLKIYELLVAKYGQPTTSNITDLASAMGARTKSVEATWKLPRMEVTFLGVLDRLDRGHISASTEKAEQWIVARQGPKSASGF